MSRFRKTVVFVLLLVMTGAPVLSFAEVPQSAVEQLLESIRQIKAEGKVSAGQKAANEKYSGLALSRLDIREVSEKALGRYWAERTAEEQKTFMELLSRLFVVEAFPNSSKFFASFKITYGKTRDQKERTVVPLTILHENEGEIEIDFHMKSNSGEWRVVDVDLDGVSMRNNLRAQFYKIISTDGFSELIRRMEDKLKKTTTGGV